MSIDFNKRLVGENTTKCNAWFSALFIPTLTISIEQLKIGHDMVLNKSERIEKPEVAMHITSA